MITAGLFVDPTLPYLAASPDGLIGDNSIIEIKCPFSIRDFTPENAYKENKIKYLEQKDDKLSLKKSHDYFYQVGTGSTTHNAKEILLFCSMDT